MYNNFVVLDSDNKSWTFNISMAVIICGLVPMAKSKLIFSTIALLIVRYYLNITGKKL